MKHSHFPIGCLMRAASSGCLAWLGSISSCIFPHTYTFVAWTNAPFISVVNCPPLLKKLSHLTQVLATPLNNTLGLNRVCVPESLPLLESKLPQQTSETGLVKKYRNRWGIPRTSAMPLPRSSSRQCARLFSKHHVQRFCEIQISSIVTLCLWRTNLAFIVVLCIPAKDCTFGPTFKPSGSKHGAPDAFRFLTILSNFS